MAANWRNEEILQSIIDGTEYTENPQSRIEDLLIQIKRLIEDSGGSSDYEKLTNKPSINNVELVDNKTLKQLGINNYTITVRNETLNIMEG